MILAHYTAQTGHLRLQPEAEIDRGVTPQLSHLVAAPGTRPIPHANGLMLAMPRIDTPGISSYVIQSQDGEPCVVGLLAWTDGPNADSLWKAAQEWPGSVLPDKPQSTPWHVVSLAPGITRLDPDTIGILGDIERCLAWTIIYTTQPAG